jgi:hypothetical protein
MTESLKDVPLAVPVFLLAAPTTPELKFFASLEDAKVAADKACDLKAGSLEWLEQPPCWDGHYYGFVVRIIQVGLPATKRNIPAYTAGQPE